MNVFELLGIISVNNDQANKAIDETSGKASSFAATAGRAFVSAGRIIGRGLAVGTAAVGTMITGSVKQYAQYEQLVGGVETLFKDSSQTVQKYANEAFVTANMSANDYMSTVTSFSASLIKSLGGDTAKAAEMGNMAVLDMADNANKMGTNLSSIQDAYQGFAKQNYTMLDNLKLGYGGTQKEMQRLLKDAQKITGKKYNLKNLSDVYEAIHVIQKEMGITGTTSQEASETISGSLATMGAAWQNLMTGIADDTQDFDALISNFTNSAINALGNISQRIPSIVNGINQLITGIVPMLPGIIQDVLPTVLEGVAGLFTGLAAALPGIAQVVFDVFTNLLSQIDFKAFGEQLGNMFVDFINNLPALLANIGSAISTGWSTIVWPMIQGLFKAVFGVELPDWETVKNDIYTGWTTVVWPAIQGFFKEKFDLELPDWETFVSDISAGWENVKSSFEAVCQNIGSLWTDNVVTPVNSAITSIDNFFAVTVPQAWNAMVTGVGTWWNDNVVATISNAISSVGEFFATIIPDPWKAMAKDAGIWWNDNVVAKIDAGIDSVKAFFAETVTPAWNATVEEIRKAWAETIAPAIDGAAQDVLGFFGIEVPSDWSLIKSIVDGWNSVVSAIGSAIAALKEFLNLNGSGTGVTVNVDGSTTGGGTGRRFATGAVFSQPTIFDTRIGRAMVGEAGPEAVAPISVLRGYVREEVEAAVGNNRDNGMKEAFQDFANSLPDMMVNAFSSVKFDVNNREFARLVKAVN